MLDREKDAVEWAVLGSWLHEAREHLDALIKDMESPDFDEVSFGWQLSHIYAHLNALVNRVLLAASHSGPACLCETCSLFALSHQEVDFTPKGSVADVSFQILGTRR